MRRAIWMALALGTAPLVALAQQGGGELAPATEQPAGSPSGAVSIERGQDTAGVDMPGAPGQQSAGSIGTAQGEPATGGAGMEGTGAQTGQTGQPILNGVPLQRPGQGGQGLTGSATGTGEAGGTSGPTYRGTTEEVPTLPPADVGTQGGSAPAARQVRAPVSDEALRRELTTLRERVARLERQVNDLGRGTGGAGTGGAGDEGTANVRAQGPVSVASATFDGRVVDVTPKYIDIVDTSDGAAYRLTIDEKTRAFVGPDLKRVPVKQLSEGTRVRTSFELISGVEYARNLVVPPPSQWQSRQRQERPQGQQEQPQEQRQEQPQGQQEQAPTPTR